MTPIPPTNVRIERADGTVVPLDLLYVGLEDGLHVWEAVRSIPLPGPGDHIAADAIPAKTTIQFALEEQGGAFDG